MIRRKPCKLNSGQSDIFIQIIISPVQKIQTYNEINIEKKKDMIDIDIDESK